MRGTKNKSRVKLFHLVLLACVFGLLGLYMFEVNSIVEERFILADVESAIQQLREESEELRIRVSEASSLDSLETLSSEFDLEEVQHITYIEVKSASPLVLSN